MGNLLDVTALVRLFKLSPEVTLMRDIHSGTLNASPVPSTAILITIDINQYKSHTCNNVQPLCPPPNDDRDPPPPLLLLL